MTAEKQEHVLFIKMTKKQDKIYQKFLNSEAVKRVITGDAVCFTVLQVMVFQVMLISSVPAAVRPFTWNKGWVVPIFSKWNFLANVDHIEAFKSHL